MNDKTKLNYVDLVLHADIPTPTMKHLILTIAVMANENGKCRPSITRLAILTGLDRRTITRNLKKLENDYWLDIDRVGTIKRKETNFYELNPRKCQVDKVSFEGRGTKPLGKKIGAQDLQPRGTVPLNTNTTAPRPTAAPQAQAGGSGVESKDEEALKTEASYQEIKRLFEEPEPSELLTDLAEPEEEGSTDSLISDRAPEEPKSFDQLFGSTEPEEAATAPVAANNPYVGRKYITQAEFDEAIENGISLFDLPEVRDEREGINDESPFS